jgi:diguanylate cyclase (GGDEF)-like protein/PAS domain S-box-containing protein
MHLPESAFRTLAENSPDMIVRYGPDGRAVYCNREIARRRQVDRQALIGRRRGETLPTDEATKRAYARIVDRALQTGEGGSIEVTAPNLQGELRVNNIVVVAERDDTGAICGALAVARDVTDLVRMREALVARERDFRTLAENSPDNIIRYGLDGRAVYCNREIEERVNVTVSRIVGRTPLESAPPGIEGVEAYQEQLLRTLATGDGGTVELRVPHPSGEMRIHSVVFAAEHDPSGAICGAVAVGRDVTGFVRMQQSLASKEHKFRTLAENAGDHIARFDADTRLLYVNPAMTRLLGRPGEEVVGLTPSEAMRTTGSTMWPVEEAIRRVARSGSEEVIELRFTPPGTQREAVHQIRLFPERDENGVVTSVLGIGRDISEKIAQLEVIESLLHTDPLTQLANRRALQQRAPALFAAAERHHNRVGVLVLDLDQFKAINDGIGHSAGDQLLCEVAHRLVRALRANDLLVRLGGDEFVVIAPDMDHAELVGVVSNRLHHALAAPLSLGTRDVRMTASIGVAVYPQDGTGLEELLANADAAMYVAKRGGRARTEYYRAELGEAVRRRLLLEQTLRHACDGPGLELHYQPQVSLHDPSRILGAEALLRWHHPTLGLLTPDAFIALAEETDLIRPIGRWVLRSAAEAVVRWNRGRNHPLHVSVNVSTRQFSDDGLPAYVDEVLAQTGCSPRWLWIEITESALLQDSARVQKTLEALRARGVRVAIDDFGTGYSALNYLGRFPIDCLKIDRSFVHAIGRSARDDELVKAFIAMATALNLSMVAEGVETAEQHAFLLAQGCVLAQGWRFGVPVPDARFLPR